MNGVIAWRKWPVTAIDQPPFAKVEGQSPHDAGIRIATCFEAIESLPDKVSIVFQILTESLGIDTTSPVVLAGRAVAAAIDMQSPSMVEHPFHNRQRICESMLCSHYLALKHQVRPEPMAELLLAALLQDYGHDGKVNGHVPFRLERQAVRLSTNFLSDAGITRAGARRLAALILATDPQQGRQASLMAYVAHTSRLIHSHERASLASRAEPEDAPELSLLKRDIDLATASLIVIEGAALPLVGLTPGHAVRRVARLSAEWRVDLGLQDHLRFIDDWLARTAVSGFFRPNVTALRAQLEHRLMR